MNLRHIIIEGPDGSGKTTLLRELLGWKQAKNESPWFVAHERASTSRGGPVANLDTWVEKDLVDIDTQPPSIYDRHPIVSELIYGTIIRGGVPGKFNSGIWTSQVRSTLAQHCLVIWCIPPWDKVRNNILNPELDQMPGVVENARRIYDEYDRASRVWPGTCIRHDYTKVPRTIGAYVDLIFKEIK